MMDDLTDWIIAEATRCRRVGESMSRLIDHCEAEMPHPDWARFRTLPYHDISPFMQWLNEMFYLDPPDRPLKKLWFGLFNPIYSRDPDGEVVTDIYVAGLCDDVSIGTTSGSSGQRNLWRPSAGYARSEVLADTYRIAYEAAGGLGNDAEYPLCLGYALFAVKEGLEHLDPSLILAGADAIQVTVGFDNGDRIELGQFGQSGLTGAPFVGP